MAVETRRGRGPSFLGARGRSMADKKLTGTGTAEQRRLNDARDAGG
jgi:hypothetical protein